MGESKRRAAANAAIEAALRQQLVAIADWPESRRGEALQELQKLHQRHPINGNVALELGRALLKCGRVTSAENMLKSVGGDARSAALCLLAEIYRNTRRLKSAINVLREVLSIQPNNLIALGMMVEIMTAQGRRQDALFFAQQAVDLAPDAEAGYFALADIHFRAGDFSSAAAVYRRCLQLGESAERLFLLGDTLRRLSDPSAEPVLRRGLLLDPQHAMSWAALGEIVADPTEARRCYYQALQLRPDWVEVLVNLAVLEAAEQQWQKAERHLLIALNIDPAHAPARYNLALALQNQDKAVEAIQHYREYLQLDPKHFGALLNNARLLRQTHQFDEAITCLRRALALSPEDPSANFFLGAILHQYGWHQDAEPYLRQALRQDADNPTVRHYLTAVLVRQGRQLEAQALAQHTVNLHPSNPEAWSDLATTLILAGKFGEAISSYQRSLNCGAAPWIYSDYLLNLHYSPDVSPDELFNAHQEYGEKWRTVENLHPFTSDTTKPTGRIHLGFVSGDFHQHSTTHFLLPVFENLDRSLFEVSCYSNSPGEDEFTEFYRNHCDHWVRIDMLTDDAALTLIRQHKLDILVDLSGHTGHNRLGLFAQRAAPRQVTWLGYPDTTGLANMDFRLIDAVTDPPGAERFCREQLFRLPRTFLCYRPLSAMPAVVPPPAACRDYVVLGVFSNFNKINIPLVDLWIAVLQQLPHARLMLKAALAVEAAAWHSTMARFEQAGVAERVSMLQQDADYTTHLQRYSEVDIMLDTMPYNGTTTVCEALWMGVPVVTLTGDRHCSRVATSLLLAVGLRECVASSPAEYIVRVRDLAADIQKLASLRLGMRERLERSPLRDEIGFTRAFEACLQSICGVLSAESK